MILTGKPTWLNEEVPTYSEYKKETITRYKRNIEAIFNNLQSSSLKDADKIKLKANLKALVAEL